MDLIDKVYQNIDERKQKGVDQRETKYIVDKILGINQIDERLLPENNKGDGGDIREGGTLKGPNNTAVPSEQML